MKNTLMIALTSLILSACAHTTMRGSVAMKINDQEAHVCLGEGEVKVGDRVNLFRNVCEPSSNRLTSRGSVCRKERIGSGVVQEVLNEHYSSVKFDPGVKFEEGTIVEKQ